MAYMPSWTDVLLPLSIILFLGLIGAFVSKKLNKPPLLAFIFLGILVSSVFKSNFLSGPFLQPLGALGVVLLLFTVGLESPLYAVTHQGFRIVIVTILQIILSCAVLFVPLVLFFHNVGLALLLSFCLALSSTAVIGKLLSQTGENTSQSGSMTLGIAIIQDLLSILFITILTTFIDQTGQGLLQPLLMSARSIVIVGGVYYVSMLVMDKLFAVTHFNREELALFTFSLLFFSLWLFVHLSIPEATAGFLIGAILAHRVEQHEIFSQVRAFRDVLLVLFFFFLGTYVTRLSFTLIVGSLLFSCLVMMLKFLVLFIILLFHNHHQKNAFWISFDLMEVGEFSFVILSLLGVHGWINGQDYQFFLMVVIWSLLIFSFLHQKKHAMYDLLNRYVLKHFLSRPAHTQPLTESSADALANIENHIVVCGYGRVGAYIGHGLQLSGIPLVVVETDKHMVRELAKKGIAALYGDATESDLLRYAHVDRARFIIVAVPDPVEQEKIILSAMQQNKNIHIITRTHVARQIRHLKALGVEYLFQPEFEAAVTILKQLLKIYKRDKDEIKKHIHYLKIEHGMAS